MIPMQWNANVKLPYYGWFGEGGFATKREARDFIAKMLRSARRQGGMFKPRCLNYTLTVRPIGLSYDAV